jgi:hypothetical protein
MNTALGKTKNLGVEAGGDLQCVSFCAVLNIKTVAGYLGGCILPLW